MAPLPSARLLIDPRTWGFNPSGTLPREREAEGFGPQLRAALRSAAGLQLTIRLVWESGATPRIRLTGDGAPFGVWVQQVLAPAYGSGRWVSSQPPDSGPSWHPPRFGLPTRALRVGQAFDPAWADAALSAMSAIPRGVQACWELQPTADPRDTRVSATLDEWVHPPERRPPIPYRRRPSPRGEPTPEVEPKDRPWLVRVSVRSLSRRTVPWLSRFESAISEAYRPVGGPLEFVRRFPGSSGRAPGWAVPTEVASGLLPSPRALFGLRPIPLGDPRFRWPLGTTLSGRPLSIQYSGSEGRHLAVLGETGMGKSSFLIALASEAISNANVVLIDPMGDTAERLLAQFPEPRLKDVRWFAPNGSACGTNALQPTRSIPTEVPTDSGEHLVELVTALRRVRHHRYADVAFWGPRIEDALFRALALAAQCPGGTLVTAWEFLEGHAPSVGTVPPAVASDIRQLCRWAADRPENVDGARRLLAEVARSSVLRRLLCEPSPAWYLDEVDCPGRITIISGEARSVGESTARVFTTLVVALLWARLLQRSPARKMCVILDEVQWYAHEAVAESLRVARRLNVHLWLATQSLEALPPVAREAAETNVADWVLFRGSIDGLRWLRGRPGMISPVGDAPLAAGQALWLEGKGWRVEHLQVAGYSPSCRNPGHGPVPGPSNPGRSPSENRGNVPSWGLDASVVPASRPSGGPGPAESALGTDLPPSEEFRVYWTSAGDPSDAGGRGLRELGGLLGRNGWLRGSGRNAGGNYWIVAAEGLEAVRRAGFWGPPETRPARGGTGSEMAVLPADSE